MADEFLNPKKAKIFDKISAWAEDYHTGYFVLKGDNPLTKNSLWTRSQRVSVNEGKGVVVRKPYKGGNGYLYLLGTLSDVEYDSLEENGTPYKKATVTYITRTGEEDFHEDLLAENEPRDFVVFGNNDKWESSLQLNDDLHKYLDSIFKVMASDLKRIMPRLAIKSRTDPGNTAKKDIRTAWESWNPVIFFTKGENELGPWEPHETEQWNPASRFSDYKAAWDFGYSLYLRLNGIKHNTSKKEERQNNPEIELNEDQFENPENIRLQEIISFLTEFYEKFGGEEYILELDGEEIFKIGDVFEEKTKEAKVGKSQPKEIINNEKLEKEENKEVNDKKNREEKHNKFTTNSVLRPKK